MTQYEHLFRPLAVGGVKTPNRLFVSPMVSNFCDADGHATERYIAYHEEKARGGWGLIITEDYAVCPEGRGFQTSGLWKDDQIAGHSELTNRVHRHGSKIFAQIYHCGRQVHPFVRKANNGLIPVSASNIGCPYMQQGARSLSPEEIQTIVDQFGNCAARAKKAGFDGVEIHGGHGYLIAQFMSWHANKRVDEYGGPLPHRLRFPLEIIADIRAKCGPDFPVTFRFSATELIRDGRYLEDSLYVARRLEEAGVDGLHVSLGLYAVPYSIIAPLNVKPGWAVHLAEAVKKAVSIPVFTVSRISEPGVAENILRMGRADAVVMGRGSLADPALPRKLKEGHEDEIRRCIGCAQGCQGGLAANEPIRCLVNPELGFEEKHECQPAAAAKKVFVAGGGVAGMQAALTCAERGHRVTLFEASPALGGQFALAAVPPEKGNLSSFPAWQIHQLKRLGVEVRLNEELTVELCRNEKPDAVIVATGSRPIVPNLPGISSEHVVLASQVLAGEAICGKKVLLAGGGMVGAETADYLADFGREVTILDMLPSIAADEVSSRRHFLMKSLEDHKVRMFTNSKLLAVEGKDVVWEHDGKRCSEEFDTVVLALGSRAYAPLVEELNGIVPVYSAGDAVKARNAMDAVREGFLAAVQI